MIRMLGRLKSYAANYSAYCAQHRLRSASTLPLLAKLLGPRLYSAREVFNYGLLLRNPAFGATPISKEQSLRLLRRINGRENLLLTEDKTIFQALGKAWRLPLPRTIAVIHRDSASVEKSDWPDSVIVKPSDGAYGRGIQVFRKNASRYVAVNGSSIPVQRLVEHLQTGLPPNVALIVQERLRPHPSLKTICNGEGISTYRIGTLREANGQVRILFHYLRLTSRHSLVDNFAWGRGGNLIVRLDPDTGYIQDAVIHDAKMDRLVVCRDHPKRGLRLGGERAPLFDEARRLAEKAALRFHRLTVVGWDIALSENGPHLIEGNAHFDPPFAALFPLSGWRQLRELAGRRS